EGINKAADHIAAVFKDAGLKPGMPDGTYFQPFRIRTEAKVGQPTALTLVCPEATIQPKLRSGFMPIGLAGEGKVEGDVGFVGHGVSAPELKYDDYEGLDVTGKIVLMLRRIPRYNEKEKPFAPDALKATLASIEGKIQNAEKHGAAAVILVNDAGTVGEGSD